MMFKPIFHPLILAAVGAVLLGLVGFVYWRSNKVKRPRWLIRGGMVALLILMAFRPAIAGGVSQQGVTNFDVLYVVDTTSSMVAEDYNGKNPRLDGVRKDVESLTKNLAGARFSIVSFNSATTMLLPYTTDTDAVASAMGTATQEITYYSAGTSIDQPLDTIKQQITQNVKAKPGRVQILFYFGDGEQTSDKKPKSFSALRSLVQGGVVMGYGTDQGGPMKENVGYTLDPGEKVDYIKDYTNTDYAGDRTAISKIDEGNLRTIAKDMGLQYQHRTQPDDTGNIVSSFQSQNLERSVKNADTATDIYWVFALGFGLLLLIDARRTLDMLTEIQAGTRNG